MSETKKYISIPSIDNCKLPNSLIRKCKEAYRRYGKWKLYDILNVDLNNHAIFNKEERDKFKKIELTKRYLYLYRKAMAETLSFVYNVNQTDLVDEDKLEFDNTNTCPYCGRPLTLLTQIGSKKGFPKSHYNDVVKQYDKLVLFNDLPVRSELGITLSEFLNELDPGIQVGYSFVYWSFFNTDQIDVNELSVNPDDPTTRIDEETLATMSDEDKEALKPQGEINLLKFVDTEKYTIGEDEVKYPNENYGKLTVYAVFKSDTDTVYKLIKNIVPITVKQIIDIYCKSLKTEIGYKTAFDFLTKKDKYYDFKYTVFDKDEDKSSIPSNIPLKEDNDSVSRLAIDNVNVNNCIDVITVYSAKEIEDANYADWGMTIRQLAIQIFKEPILKDIIYKSKFADDGKTLIPEEGTEETVGIYKFFQWSLYKEGDVFILEDDRSKSLVRSVESVLNDDILTIYALFKYDIKIGTYAYDDDCYSSLYHLYKGIDKAYVGYTNPDEGFVYEYKVNESFANVVTGENVLLLKKDFSRLPLTSKVMYEYDSTEDNYKLLSDLNYYIHKETTDTEQSFNIPSIITSDEYEALPDGLCRAIYDEQRSCVSYRGYPLSAGSGSGGMRYFKDNKIRVIKYNAINKNGTVSVENGRKTQRFSNFGNTEIELTYTTPGDFEIWYYIPRYLWYIYDSDIDEDNLSALQTTWVFNSDPLNEEKYLTTEPPADTADLYTRFISAKMISRTEYLTLTSENKNRCIIDRIYYEHQWDDEEQVITDSTGAVTSKSKYTIQEIFNCKNISEYNTQVGTADKSFGVDTKTYADMTKETFRIYQYNLRLDKNVEAGSDFTQDNEIGYVESECGLEFTGDTWLFPITTSNRQDFLQIILGARSEVIHDDSRFLKNGKIIFLSPDISDILNIPENESEEDRTARENLLDYTRLLPTDNTGINQLYYMLTGLWKCVLFTNGQLLIYRAGDRRWPNIIEPGYVANKVEDKIRLKDLVYKYAASLRINIEHSIDENNSKYVVAFRDITLTAPGATNYAFYNTADEDVVLVETIASIAYTSKSDIIKFDDSTQYIKYSDNAVQTRGYGVSYMVHLTKDVLRSYFDTDQDTKARELFEKLKTTLVDPESPDYYELRTGIDSNGKEYIYYVKTDGNLRYQTLKNIEYDDLDKYHKIYPTTFMPSDNGENYDKKKEYFDLVDGDYIPLPRNKFIISNHEIIGTQSVSYVKGIYLLLQWEDIANYVTTTSSINGIQIERLRSPEYNKMLYRQETALELTLRKEEYFDIYGINPTTGESKETKVTVEFSGKRPAYKPEDGSDPDFECSVYSKWNSSVNAVIQDKPVIISGGYPNPSSNIRTDSPSDGQFIEESIEFVALRRSIVGLSKSSISYSGDVQSVIDNESGENQNDKNKEDVKELDDRVWWNQYSKLLTGEAKNNFITNYGVNFSGWIWTGWKEGVSIADDGSFVIGGDSKEVEGGLIEAYPFEASNKANYVSQGFQRILFPKDINSTFETDQYDTVDSDTGFVSTHNKINGDGLNSKLVNKIDAESGEPFRLLRYCSNSSCEMYLKRLDKRKWSYQDRDSGIHTTNSVNSFYNMLSLDEHLLPIGKDGTFKFVKANKFSADEPDKTAKFGISDIPKLVTVEPVDNETPEFGGWTLDKYPWHYGEDEATKAKYNEYVRYYLHRGGNGLPDPFRFEFEWKYATNEFSATKMSGYGNGYNLDNTSIQLDTIKQIDHRTKNKIIPIESRPIEEYQKKYLDVLFNTFENTYIHLQSNTSPYSMFSQEEIYVMNEILTDLFTFNKNTNVDNKTDYIKFKLEIVTLMNDISEYEFNLANYWNDGDYENNKFLLETFYEQNHGNGSSLNLINLTDVEFENAVLGKDLNESSPQSIFPYYTCRLTNETWDKFEGHPIRRIIVKREYTPSVNITIRDIIDNVWSGAPSYTGYKFMGWFKDPLTFNQYYPDTSEGTTVISAGDKFTAYFRFDAGEITKDELGNEIFTPGVNNILGTLLKSLLTFEKDNEIYLKIDVKDLPSKIWYIGKDAIVSSIKNRLAVLHEKLMLPTEFMCSLFNFIVSPKKYNILETNKGDVSSLFVQTGIITTNKSDKILSVSRTPDSYTYKGAVISKPWKMSTVNDTGKSVKEQYYIIYNNNAFDAYSFFNEGWLKDIYGAENATLKFPLYRDTENPIIHNATGTYDLIDIIPFSTDKYESALALIYDKGILLVNLTGIHNDKEDTQWIKLSDGDKLLSPEKLFNSNSLTIVDCKLDNYNDKNNLVIVSSDSQIAAFDLETEQIYNPNINYLSGVTHEELDSVRNLLPIMFKKTDNVIGDESRSRLFSKNKAITTINESEATLIGEDENRYLEKRVGLSLLIGKLVPSNYEGDPWILMPKYIDSGLPQTLSDINYEKLLDVDKNKYKIHPKLTVKYAWNNSSLKNYIPDNTVDYEYVDLYTDEFTPSTEGEFRIYHDGILISRKIYFGYSDEIRKECLIYKITKINYTFVRLSFSNEGLGFYDEEFEARLSKEKLVYAFYYKTGVEVDEHYGYKIKITEHIVDGKDTIYSDVFNEHLNANKLNAEKFNRVKKIPGWKTVNSFTDYTMNVVDKIEILENIKKIFPINGYIDGRTGQYIYQYIISDGFVSQLIQWYDSKIYILCEYNFEDNNELVNVKTVEDEISTYLIFKNQRIVILDTYEYVPSELSIARNDNIDFFIKTDSPNTESNVSYVTKDKRIVNVSLSNTTYLHEDNPTIYCMVSEDKLPDNAVSLINCEIQQTDPFRYVSNDKRWHVLEGNDRSKLLEAQIN